MEVKFYDTVNDELLKFAVIISQSNGKWVFCMFLYNKNTGCRGYNAWWSRKYERREADDL